MIKFRCRFPHGSLSAWLATALLLSGCSADKQPQGQGTRGGPVVVSTMQVASRPVPIVLDAVGRTEGSREVEVRARVSGILEKQAYTEGNTVERGAVLFHIDRAPFEIALAHARAALAEQKAASMQAQRNADRLAGLAKQNAVSQRVADDAISALESANAALLAAQANVQEAELNLSYTKVTASIGGITGRALHSEGSLVTAGAESSLMTTVTQSDPLWVRFAVSDVEFATLRDGMRSAEGEGAAPSRAGRTAGDGLSVTLLRKNGEPYPNRGHVNFAGSEVDAQLGTVQLRAEFPNPDLGMLPGQYLRVRLSGGAQPAILVPQTAVLQSPKGPYVWMIDDKNQAQQRVVQTGVWIGTDWQIREGLAAGESIIVDNLLKLKPGQSVRAQPAAAQPARVAEGTAPANSVDVR